jgi:hypothetical protein
MSKASAQRLLRRFYFDGFEHPVARDTSGGFSLTEGFKT